MCKGKLFKLKWKEQEKVKPTSKMTLAECKSLLYESGVAYTDEEVEEIKEYVYVLAEIIYNHYGRLKQRQKQSTASIINLENYESETTSHTIHTGKHRRAS